MNRKGRGRGRGKKVAPAQDDLNNVGGPSATKPSRGRGSRGPRGRGRGGAGAGAPAQQSAFY